MNNIIALAAFAILVFSNVAFSEDVTARWADKVSLRGTIDVEMSHVSSDSVTEQDITAAAVEVGIVAAINKYVNGDIFFLWEGDDEDRVAIDRAVITIRNKEAMPVYLTAGKFRPGFGYFSTHMISYPITLEIAETTETAIAGNFENEWFLSTVSIFRGDVKTLSSDPKINGFIAALNFHNPGGTIGDLMLNAGISYTTNIADSDGLTELVSNTDAAGNPALTDLVPAYSAYLTADYEMLSLIAEYVGVVRAFEAGDMDFDGDGAADLNEAKPFAFNVELAVRPTEKTEIGLRYEGSEDLNGFMPEERFGGVINYDVLDNTVIGLEYLYSSDEDANAFTAGLGIYF